MQRGGVIGFRTPGNAGGSVTGSPAGSAGGVCTRERKRSARRNSQIPFARLRRSLFGWFKYACIALGAGTSSKEE